MHNSNIVHNFFFFTDRSIKGTVTTDLIVYNVSMVHELEAIACVLKAVKTLTEVHKPQTVAIR